MDGVVADMDPRADRLHDRGSDDIARHGGGRGYPEEQDEHGRDESGTPHSGEADHDSGEETAESESKVDVGDGHPHNIS